MIFYKKIYCALVLMFFVFVSNAQTTHFSDDFNIPACTFGCLGNGYNGWTVTNTGLNGIYANDWFRSCAENGNLTGTCGSGCGNDATLHIANVPNSPSSILCFPNGQDCGAAYDAGFGTGDVVTDKRAESPFIDLTCATNPVTISFKYIEAGQGTTDNFSLDYFDGAIWTQIDDPAKTINNCAGQGRWTLYSFNLPASAAANPNVKIGFHWVNDDDGVGTDPSVAIDSVRLTSPAAGPVADFLISNSAPCQNDCIDFTDISTGNIVAWAWDFGGGAIPNISNIQNPTTICFNTLGVFNITLTVTDACGLTSSQTYQVGVGNCTGAITADFQAFPTTICAGDQVGFLDVTQGFPVSWEWDFPGGVPSVFFGQNPPPITYSTAGVYDVTLIVDDGLGTIDTLTQVGFITVNNCGGPVANFSVVNQNICVGDCIDFFDLSLGTVTSWDWSFIGATPSSSTLQNPTTICYNTVGVYDVKLTVSDGTNINTLIMPGYITVNNCTAPVANFTANSTNFCSGTCISFNDLSTGNILTWSWSFQGATPATSNAQNPTNICYNTPGVYDVTLTVDDGTTTNTITVPAYITVNNCNTPTAAFTPSATNLCTGQCINFTDNSTNATTWGWGFPGGTPNFFIGQNPPQICYAVAGIYDVAQYVADANGNTDTLVQTGYITVANCGGPTAAFNVNATVGCRNDCFTFTDASVNATSWTWSFPGGNPSSFIGQTPPPICYNNLGLYSVTLIVSDGTLSDTLTQPGYMTINYCGGLLAMFIASDTDICAGDCICFINESQGNPQGYLWIIPGAQPDTSTSTNPPYVCFPNAGDYDVTLIAFDSTGADTVTYTNYIHVNLGTNVTTNIDSATIFAGQTIPLSASGGVSYKWYPSGSLDNDSIPNPTASPNDTTLYVVVMTDANGCTSSETILINVLPPETIWAPTAFTPNNDKSNDVFNIYSSGIMNNFTMRIYDRWGDMMFQTHDRLEGWDGTYFNKPLNTGVYVYYYRIEYIDGFILEGSGDVTLIR